MQIKRIFSIALVLMFGGVMIVGIFTLNQEGFQPRVEAIEDKLRNDVGTTTVEIGKYPHDSQEDARKQMEGLIAWNAIASSNCRILPAVYSMSSVAWDEDTVQEVDDLAMEDAGDKIMNYESDEEGAEGWINGAGDKPAILENNKNMLYEFVGFQPLTEAGFTKTCIGSESVVKEIEKTVKNAAESAAGSLFGGVAKWGTVIIGGAGVGLGAIACGATVVCAGGLIAASAVIAGPISSGAEAVGEWAGEALVPGATRNFAKDVGFDMEGKVGRVNFIANRTFYIGEGGTSKPIIGMNFRAVDPDNPNDPDAKPDWKDEDTPGFWRGKRFMYAIPPGLAPTEDDGSECCSLEPPSEDKWDGGPFDGENNYDGSRSKIKALYAWRVRMKAEDGENIPLVTDNQLDLSSTNPDVNALRNLLENTKFVICEGAEGYVQSNAKSMFNEKESQHDDSEKEDQVYPMVKIESGSKSCLNPEGSYTNDEMSGISGVGDFESKTYLNNLPDFLSCDNQNQIGQQETIFRRQKLDGGFFTTNLLCGGDEKTEKFSDDYQNDEAITYDDEVVYFTPEFKMEGCSPAHYDITDFSDTSSNEWMHSTTKDYENGGTLRDQLSHKKLDVKHASSSDDKTFEIKINYETQTDRRVIVGIEEGSNSNKVHKLATYKGGNLIGSKKMERPLTQRIHIDLEEGNVDLSVDGENIKERAQNLNNEISPKVELGSGTSETNPGTKIEAFEIKALNDVESINNDVSAVQFSENQGGLDIEEVLVQGEPRVCDHVTTN